MDDSRKCPKCQTRMETGFIPDMSYGAVLQSRWHPGKPRPAFSFLGLSMKGAISVDYRDGLPITAWRCTKCALVELYAEKVD